LFYNTHIGFKLVYVHILIWTYWSSSRQCLQNLATFVRFEDLS